jgi:hypothetical protein
MSSYQQILTEIVKKVQIDRDFTVSHPDYPPLQLPPDAVDRFRQMPSQLQQKYAIDRLQNYLYDLYFTHSLNSLEEIAIAAAQPTQISNNTINGVDLNFYRQLQESNSGHGYLDPDWRIIDVTEAGELIAVKDGLHLHINPHQHLPRHLSQAKIGEIVPIYLPPSLVGQDTYIIVGNAGAPDRSQSVEIYFHFTPDAALAIAKQLTPTLNKLDIPFQFAILHHPDFFARYDGGTLWLSQAGYLAIQTVLAEIYHTHQAEFSAEVPLFTKQLAPGLGIAEVPTTSSTFGMQRCELLATAILAAIDRDRTSPSAKLQTIHQQLKTAGINPIQPYLNPTASDCYHFELKSKISSLF